MSHEERVGALKGAVAELLDGYTEVARLLADAEPALRDAVLTPLRRAADNAAAALAAA
jgi:hypothetical protein